jgi:SAM-dependent methyltransferase
MCQQETVMTNEQKDAAAAREFYNAHYQHDAATLYAEINGEVVGEHFGQTSWLTAEEQDRLITWLGLDAASRVLDVACGVGGPSLRMARQTGCSLVGIDIHDQGVANATEAAERGELADRVRFQRHDANDPLPFPDASFDAVVCIDAINHLKDRKKVIGEWVRVLKPEGRIAFTDPITVTGPLTNEEIAIRTAIGFYLLVPAGYDEQVLADAGLALLFEEDTTDRSAAQAARWLAARARRESALREIEGDAVFEAIQTNIEVSHRITAEHRLSRFTFVATRPNRR